MEITFEKYKKQIQTRLKEMDYNEDDFILIDGFVNQQLQNTLTGGIVVGGPSIPCVVVVDKTGKLHYLALKIVLPDISYE